MEKGMAGERGGAMVAAAEPAADPMSTVERGIGDGPLTDPRPAGGGGSGGAANPPGPMVRPGVINGLDGRNWTLDEYPNWPHEGPPGELYGPDGGRLVKDEDGHVTYVDADGREFNSHEWIRPSDPSQPDGLGPRIYDVWTSGDDYFGQPHANDVAQQIAAGEAPSFESRTLDQLKAERARQ
jgi:hypothetical protein